METPKVYNIPTGVPLRPLESPAVPSRTPASPDVEVTVEATRATPSAETTQESPALKDLRAVLAEAAQRAGPARARLRVDEQTNRLVIQFLDDNAEVVRQIPPEEMLKVLQRVRDLWGLVFDELA